MTPFSLSSAHFTISTKIGRRRRAFGVISYSTRGGTSAKIVRLIRPSFSRARELGGQHVLGDARQATLQLAEAMNAMTQQPEDFELPAAGDHADGTPEFGLNHFGQSGICTDAIDIDH